MKTRDIGNLGEDLACGYLYANDFKIIARNWKNRWCEIDIIARKVNTIYFIEVKYRQTDSFGSGFDYITHAKLKQMTFAAELWLANYSWDLDSCLAAISVSGQTNSVSMVTIS